MSDEPDPEVIADLRLRAASEHDRSRARSLKIYDWKQPEFVGSWPCRRPGCKGRFDVQDDDIARFNMFNRELAKKNEQGIKPSDVAYCEPCKGVYVATAANRRRGLVEKLRVLIVELKASRDPAGEKELLEKMKAMHHPDIPGLIEAIRTKGEKQTSGKRARASEVLQ